MNEPGEQNREISKSINLQVSVERCFQTLITPSEIRQWWHCASAIVVAKQGGIWAARWGDEDDPDYVVAAKIVLFQPP